MDIKKSTKNYYQNNHFAFHFNFHVMCVKTRVTKKIFLKFKKKILKFFQFCYTSFTPFITCIKFIHIKPNTPFDQPL